MKVVFVVRSLDVGGAERQLATLASALHQQGRDVTVLAFYDLAGPIAEALRVAGMRLLLVGKRGRRGIALLLDVYRLRFFASRGAYGRELGMSPWRDVVDWIGGWPFEVTTPEAVFRFYRDRGFVLQNLVTRQGYGCNEFVFRENAD